jgi:hypothetical protein
VGINLLAISDFRFAIVDGRLPDLKSTDLRHGAHEFREISAIARRVIKRVEAGVHGGFGQSDTI